MTWAEIALTAALDREWLAQSDRMAPLEPTVPVRTALELVLAGTPVGIFTAGRVTGATPEQVVAEVREDLPAELSPWTRRTLTRVGALRESSPLLGPGEPVRALPTATEPLPIALADIPQLPVRAEPAPDPSRRGVRAWLARLFGGRR
jgi:hypothetical protein